MSEVEYPKDCRECSNSGVSELTCFPSLCKRNYLWFQCRGKFGIKIEIQRLKCKGCNSEYMPLEHRYKGYCCIECYNELEKELEPKEEEGK